MKPINECIVISNTMFAGLFSGYDVWLIPYDIQTSKFNYDKAYVWDDWSIENQTIYGRDDEWCVIAVEPDQVTWMTCDEEFIFENKLVEGWEYIDDEYTRKELMRNLFEANQKLEE